MSRRRNTDGKMTRDNVRLMQRAFLVTISLDPYLCLLFRGCLSYVDVVGEWVIAESRPDKVSAYALIFPAASAVRRRECALVHTSANETLSFNRSRGPRARMIRCLFALGIFSLLRAVRVCINVVTFYCCMVLIEQREFIAMLD